MELRDFIVTPIILFIVYTLAYFLRPRFTDINTRRYFIPALTVKIIGAICVGLIYQFYYDGGDTFNFHTHGSRHIWEAFMDDPNIGFKLLFSNGEEHPEAFKYYSKIYFYRDMSSYFVIRIAALFDLFTFSTYSATAVLFATFSFSGIWALYQVFYRKFNELHFQLAIAVFFIPTVFFWGSGIYKDTITLGALGWVTYSTNKLLLEKNIRLIYVLIFLISAYIIFEIKIYILLCLLPAVIIWVFAAYFDKIGSSISKILLAPLAISITLLLGYFAVLNVAKNDTRYAVDKIAETARITAHDLAYWTGRGAGSTYDLGQLDGTFLSMFKLAPAAINASLFRPYLWEVSNPLMALSAFESFLVTLFTLYILYRTKIIGIFRKSTQPIVLFCLVFSIVFAFAVGVSTFNFGTLSRYKIPLMPFFLSALLMILYQNKKPKVL